MNNASPSRINKDQLEKVLIGAVLAPALLIAILKEPSLSTPLLYVHLLGFTALIGLYISITPRNYWTALVAGLVLYPLSILWLILDITDIVFYNTIALSAVYTIGGVLFAYQSLKKSIQFKSFESLGFLLGVFLTVFPFLSLWLGKDFTEISLVYKFGVAFIIGTIMYNDNLWEQYQTPQKKFIILVLLIALTNIIAIASKQL